ncbi:MAG: hemerythrin domain-containing protein [Acidiferrobacterales bacterium]
MQLPDIAPDFNEPIEMLRACHVRILRQCETLIRLAEHIGSVGITDDGCTAARQVRRYFSTAGRHHHEDEEQDLFPTLATTCPELLHTIQKLKQDHREMDCLWTQLEPLLADLGSIIDTAAFAREAMRFRVIYHAHIERENSDILPAAQQALPSAQLRELGLSMARRRGVRL